MSEKTQPCYQCNGSGRWPGFGCSNCGGSGREVCPACAGGALTVGTGGLVRCGTCGNRQTVSCYKCNGTGSEMGPCLICNGSGKV